MLNRPRMAAALAVLAIVVSGCAAGDGDSADASSAAPAPSPVQTQDTEPIVTPEPGELSPEDQQKFDDLDAALGDIDALEEALDEFDGQMGDLVFDMVLADEDGVIAPVGSYTGTIPLEAMRDIGRQTCEDLDGFAQSGTEITGEEFSQTVIDTLTAWLETLPEDYPLTEEDGINLQMDTAIAASVGVFAYCYDDHFDSLKVIVGLE